MWGLWRAAGGLEARVPGAKSPAMGDFCNFSKVTHFLVFMHISAKIINLKQ